MYLTLEIIKCILAGVLMMRSCEWYKHLIRNCVSSISYNVWTKWQLQNDWIQQSQFQSSLIRFLHRGINSRKWNINSHHKCLNVPAKAVVLSREIWALGVFTYHRWWTFDCTKGPIYVLYASFHKTIWTLGLISCQYYFKIALFFREINFKVSQVFTAWTKTSLERNTIKYIWRRKVDNHVYEIDIMNHFQKSLITVRLDHHIESLILLVEGGNRNQTFT